jgi:hypothetical protein
MRGVEEQAVAGKEGCLEGSFHFKSSIVKKDMVRFTPDERTRLGPMVHSGKAAARVLLHARILLKAASGPEAPAGSDEASRAALEVHTWKCIRRRWPACASALSNKASQRPGAPNWPRASTSANSTAPPQRTALLCVFPVKLH